MPQYKGQKESDPIKVITKSPNNYGWNNDILGEYISDEDFYADLNGVEGECYYCLENNSPLRRKGEHQSMNHDVTNGWVKAAIPVEPFSIYVCDKCWNYEDRDTNKT